MIVQKGSAVTRSAALLPGAEYRIISRGKPRSRARSTSVAEAASAPSPCCASFRHSASQGLHFME